MRVVRQLQPALLLHRRDYRNTSLLLDVFSADYGRVGLVAKGARRRNAAGGPLLQPFQPLLLSWSGAGELYTLTGVEAAADRIALVGGGLLCGFYLNELLLRLLARDDDYADLFDYYLATLRALQHAGDGEAAILRAFELRLLQELGYALVLDHCVDADVDAGMDRGVDAGVDQAVDQAAAIEPMRRYTYDFDSGPRANAGDGADALQVQGSTLLTLAAGGVLDRQGQREARALLRGALAVHLGERPLHSRRLYQQYLRLRGAPPSASRT